jgi:hypothetical protein
MVDRLRVTRNQLAAFIPDFQTIKQIERLIQIVDDVSPSSDTQGINILAGNADASANEALALINELSHRLGAEGGALAGARATQALSLINELSQQIGLQGDARATQALTLINDLSQRLGVLQGAPTQPQDASTAADYIDFRPLAPHAQRIRRLAWSDTDQTLEIGMDYGVLQQIGMNVYARVENSTGSTISRGEVVGFAGVGPGGVLSVAPYLADGSTPSLYILGVMAHDLPNAGEIGYCTVWGHVLGIDTSAFSVGDVLYASPSSAGGFTATKPTAPNNVIPTAAVLIDDATAGQIFVRPTIEQQKYYGEFTKTTSQSPAATNTAYALTFDNTEIAGGVVIGVTTSQIIVPESGLYQFDTTIQISSSNSSDKNVWVWFRKNGANIANSARIVTINTNGGYVPVTLIEFFSLAANDYIEIMFAANATAVAITSVAATAFAPAAPAVVLAVTQIQQ